MRKWIFLLAAILLLAIALVPALAQGELQVQVDEYRYEFATSIDFHLVADAPEPIAQVYLIFKLGDSNIVQKRSAEFTPGTHVDAKWTWELKRGTLAPGTRIRYYWRLIAEDGTVYKTKPVSFRYEDTRFEWHSLSEGPVTLYWYEGSEDFARELMEAAQKALSRLQDEMGVNVEGPVYIYVYASSRDMREVVPKRSESFDEFSVTLGIVLSEDTLAVLGTDPDVEKTIAHELSHLVVAKATENPLNVPLPRWLDEGLAMYAEGELPPANRRALERAIRSGELISVRSLSGYVGDPSKIDLFYAEAYSVVEFLIKEYGKEKMTQLLAKFAEGAYQEDALREVYGFGLDELDARWKEYLGVKSPQPTPRQRLGETPVPTPATGPEPTPPGGKQPLPCPGISAIGVAAALAAWKLRGRR